MVEAYVNADLSFGFIDGLNAVVKTGTGAAGSEAGAAPTVSVVKGNSGEVSFWGEDNLFPQNVVKDVEASTIMGTLLNQKAKTWYGGGIVAGLVEVVNGEEVFTVIDPAQYPEIAAFVKKPWLKRYALEALIDVAYFGNAFPELIVSRNRRKITRITEQEAPNCRYARAKGPLEMMRWVYINANWANGGRYDDEYCTKVPTIDPYVEEAEDVRARKDGFKYIYPVSFPSPDKAEYQLASWNSVRSSGWLDVAKAVVEFKKMLLKQILSIEFIIEVHPAYWTWKFKDWDEKDDAQRRQLIKQELDNFGAVMAGSNGAGKSLMTTQVQDSKGEFVPAFKVTSIDKKRSDNLNEDSQEAAWHAFVAGGVSPALMGVTPGKSMGGGAGGGSEPRVLFNNFISTSTYELDMVLEPLHFIRDFNGWPANLEFRFKQPLIMTLDKGKQTQQETA